MDNPDEGSEVAQLPPQPLLLVATSDAVLRLYTLGNARADAPLAVEAARELPPAARVTALLGIDAGAGGAPADELESAAPQQGGVRNVLTCSFACFYTHYTKSAML